MDWAAADGGEQPGAPPDPTDGAGAGPTRSGRRGNGLPAERYAALAVCEPQIGYGLLRALAAEGIAAYAVPYEGRVGGYLEAYPPDRPLVQLWVDTAATAAARELLEGRRAVPAEPPAMTEGAMTKDTATEDAAWADIVAALRRPGPDGPVPWPAAEDLTRTPGPAHRAGAPAATSPPDAATGGTAAWRPPPEEPAEEEEHFVPPPPPPVPMPSGPSAYGIAALIGGFAVLLVPTMAGDPVGPALLVLAIVAIVGGFGMLVARMRQDSPAQDDPDDGAVI